MCLWNFEWYVLLKFWILVNFAGRFAISLLQKIKGQIFSDMEQKAVRHVSPTLH